MIYANRSEMERAGWTFQASAGRCKRCGQKVEFAVSPTEKRAVFDFQSAIPHHEHCAKPGPCHTCAASVPKRISCQCGGKYCPTCHEWHRRLVCRLVSKFDLKPISKNRLKEIENGKRWRIVSAQSDFTWEGR
jgi:hypothetical protein